MTTSLYFTHGGRRYRAELIPRVGKGVPEPWWYVAVDHTGAFPVMKASPDDEDGDDLRRRLAAAVALVEAKMLAGRSSGSRSPRTAERSSFDDRPHIVELHESSSRCRHGFEVQSLRTGLCPKGWCVWGYHGCLICGRLTLACIDKRPDEVWIAGRLLPVQRA